MIGVSCPGFSLEPIAKIGKEIAEHFDLWEIVAEGEQFLPLHKKEIRSLCASYKLELQVHAPISDINIGSLNPGMRSRSFEELWETLDACNELGITLITVHPGYLSPLGFYAPEKAFVRAQKTLKDLEKVNRGFGLKICLENMPQNPILTGSTPKEITEMIEGTEMSFCFDVGHANTSTGIKSFKPLMKKLGNVHIHDNKGKKDEHLVIGEGTVDWAEAKETLKGYKGNMIIESRGLEHGLKSLKKLKTMKWIK